MAAPCQAGLSAEQIAQFHRDGYLVVERWWDAEEVATLKAAGVAIIQDFDASTVSVFSTNEQTRTSDAYFLESGDKVRCFFEERAFGPDGKLVKPKEACINKIGHNLHGLVPEFRKVTLEDARVAAVFRSLGYERPVVPQSMYITKSPGIGGEVRPHVDGAFLYTEPDSVTGLWWPLEDCTTSNGCLWAVPGSHNTPVRRRFKRNAAGTGTEFEPAEAGAPFELTGAVPLEIPAGSLVLLHASLVHYSEANTSEKSRHAFSIHVVEGGKGVVYPKDNWLQVEGGFPALY